MLDRAVAIGVVLIAYVLVLVFSDAELTRPGTVEFEGGIRLHLLLALVLPRENQKIVRVQLVRVQ